MIDCTDEQLIEEVRRRGFVIRDAQIGRKWIGLTEEEVALIWNDMGARPKINGYDFAKVIEKKLKERNAMSNAGMLMSDDEWQEKYTKMRIFYEDRIQHLDEMLVKSMEMNLKLVGMLQGRAAGQKAQGEYCTVCGIKGLNGTVSLCTYKNCPNNKGFNHE